LFEFFKSYCNEIKDKNIAYITGNLADERTVMKIDKKQWDIVLSLDSLQFMNHKDSKNTCRLVEQHLKEQGIFIIKTKRKSEYQYGSDDPLIYDYDVDLHNNFQKTFINYKILNAFINDESKVPELTGKISGLTLYKL
jgi:hypothetical protein